MASELIRLDPTHISVKQMRMHVDRVLQCYIRNISAPPLPLIENYLRQAEDASWTQNLSVQLQLGLPVDGYTVTGSTQSTYWSAVCYELLGAIPDRIKEGRIEMGWLRDKLPEPDDDSTELERIQYDRTYILEIIGGYLMPDLSQNLAAGELSWGSTVLATLYREMCGATVPNKAKIEGCLSLLQSWARYRLPFLRPRVNHPHKFPLITRWNHSASYVGILTSLEDIRLLLDQWLEAQFQWTPYEDLAIRAVIPDEFFQNPNIWHVNVPMVTYAIVEMHQSDRVLRQFGF
ncbi:hypothetical protein J1N35_033250 [Gossypium stocksii]|uniref:Aminotransferase-like plant mobile domain-containing protein n=1 Tax=Gossypium stocksii TaxID=47602 RepID=A0A9D3UPT6_9ROSI|nr:hypothetical protein J1N35_033250 [Gossypium stocksii]